MRRWISAILAAMLLGLTACGSASGTSAPEEQFDSAQEQPTDVQEANDVQEAESTDDRPALEATNDTEVFASVRNSIYVNYDAGLRTKSHGPYILAYDTNNALVGVIYDGDHEYTGDLAGVPGFFSAKFLRAAETSSSGHLSDSQIEVLESEPCTINSFDSIRFTGTCCNTNSGGNEWDCHVYGYSFIINDTAVAIIGLVSAQEQDSEMIATIDARVDAMAATIRTER